MKATTLKWIRCPKQKPGRKICGGILAPERAHESHGEIHSGSLRCKACSSDFPIISGVAVLMENPREYILEHAPGIARYAEDLQIPLLWRKDYARAKSESGQLHIEESLESERVNALYLATHFLSAKEGVWWRPPGSSPDPLLDTLMNRYWDHGPLQRVADWLGSLANHSRKLMVAELGCGTGGLRWKSDSHTQLYIGVDSSFSSVAQARAIQDRKEIQIPGDLLQGTTSRKVKFQLPSTQSEADFVVGDLRSPPLDSRSWDCVVSMNTIDMLERPEDLPRAQFRLLKVAGHAIQSSPYVWHPQVAKAIKKKYKDSSTSERVIEELYSSCGLELKRSESRIPWLFFKHDRQIEIYWTHLFSAIKGSSEA